MKKYSAAKAAIETSAPTSCGSGRKMPPIEMVLPPSQECGDAAIVRREEELRQPAHHDRKPEGGEDLHHAGIGLGPHREAHDQQIDHRAEHEQRRGDQRRRQQRIDREEREQEEGRVHRDHQELAMGEVHDVHQAEDQRQADRDQAVEQPHQQAARETLDNGLRLSQVRPPHIAPSS